PRVRRRLPRYAGWSSPKASATSPAPDPPRHDRANAPTLAAPHAAPHPPLLEICPPCPASANQRKDGITPAIRWLHPWNLLRIARGVRTVWVANSLASGYADGP